ncbi:MAG: glutamate synthase subunit alpha, partial [Candidatus Heimdallarchaeota archaeon]|nr:glutamate synthase subunit alpha [Candidatus Heimdallarchaeota archaeon]
YFKQLFAQVTNPPVDPIREEIVMAEEVLLGAEGDLLKETKEHCRRLRLKRPIITNRELAQIREIQENKLQSVTLSAVFNKADGVNGLELSLAELFQRADEAIDNGCTILVLSDNAVDKDTVPMPSLLACSGLHHYLIRQGVRTKVSIVLETGEAREMHHFAVLIGYGANAINPYLAFESIENEIAKGGLLGDVTFEEAEKNILKSTRKGLFKIISKMGISTIQSYCGAQIFEAVGLGEDFVEKYFTATPSRIGGIGVETVAEEMLRRHEDAYPINICPEETSLDVGGKYRWRKTGEHHQINPETISLLQQAVRTGSYELYKKYSSLINEHDTNLANIRALLKFKKRTHVPIEEVEPVSEIVKRFATGAMSFGSISREAHETLAIAMN